mmetsp:Transcript_82096/g.219697  ORF Transcript_82096/g.219697 Transcript_82096/m.219697 type:complete len:198 (+) Transcript_82096:69-662(+)
MAANQEQYDDEIPFYDQYPQEERTVADTAELDRDAGAKAIFHAQGLLHMLDDPENIAKVNWSPEVHQELDKLRRFAEACPDFARAAGHLHRKLCLECIALSYLLPRQDLLHLAGHWIDLLGHGRVDRFQIDFGEVAYVLEELDKLVDGPNDPADTLYEQLEAWYTELKRVEPDHICPAGLEFRMDMETGRNFARLSS